MQYYTKFDFDYSSTIHDIYKQLLTEINIPIATDGGSIPHQRLLCFLVVKEDETCLFTCYGQPTGIDPHSYRSKICALLADSRILRLLVEYYDMHICNKKKIKAHIKLITDHKSTLTKIKSMNKYTSAPMKVTMHPKWDVLYALYDELKCFSSPSYFKFVTSHQNDDDKIYFSISTQLNVHTGKLASEGLKKFAPKYRVPLDSIVKVKLHHDGRHIP